MLKLSFTRVLPYSTRIDRVRKLMPSAKGKKFYFLLHSRERGLVNITRIKGFGGHE